MQIICILLSMIFCANVTCAATYYADSTAGACTGNYSIAERNCSGSDGNSYATIQAAINVATTPGDFVYIRSGTYLEHLESAGSGEYENYITVSGYGSDTVNTYSCSITHDYVHIAKIRPTRHVSGTGYTFSISGDHNKVSGCVFGWGNPGNPGTTAMYITGTYNDIDGNTFDTGATSERFGTHTGDNGSSSLVDSNQSWDVNDPTIVGQYVYNEAKLRYGLITANTATEITATLNLDATWTTGDYYRMGPTFHIGVSDLGGNTIYQNNIIKNIHSVERFWNLASDNITITGNEAYNWLWSGNAGSIHPDIIQVLKSTGLTTNNLVIENNYFHDISAQIGISEEDDGDDDNWTIRNNVFANIDQRMMFGGRYIKILNNTFYNVNIKGSVFDMPISNRQQAKNNIIIGGDNSTDTTGMIAVSGSAPYNGIISHNYYGTLSHGERGSSLISDCPLSLSAYCDESPVNGGDVKFVAPYTDCVNNTCDFSLRTDSSPIIGRGEDLSAYFTTDILGNTRTGTWDIGAYEYNPPTIGTQSLSGGSLGGGAMR